jgi:hypothetical protein
VQEADHILIPLLNGEHALAQVVQVQDQNAVIFVTQRASRSDGTVITIQKSDVLAVVPVSLETLPENHWRIIGYDAIPNLNRRPADLTSDEVALHDPAIVEAFVNAIHGLYPWDGFPDPGFFTNLLSDADTLPPKARMTTDFPSRDA